MVEASVSYRASGHARRPTPKSLSAKKTTHCGSAALPSSSSSSNPWISHVQAYRASHGCSYAEAMQGAKNTYRAHAKGKEPPVTTVLYIGPDKNVRSETACPPHPGPKFVRITAISDAHTQERFYPFVPPCDLLVFSGDMLFKNVDADGNPSIDKFFEWIKSQTYKKLVFIAGNHEDPLEKMGAKVARAKYPGYIEDELVNRLGLRIYGSPVSRPYTHGGETEEDDTLGGNKSFQAHSFDRVAKIPDKDVDVLITHGAPKGICDTINNTPVGCPVLLRKVRKLRPRLHIFGHVHCQTVSPHGDKRAFVDPETGTIYVNACNLADFAPKPGGRLFPPVVIDLPKPRKPSECA